MFAKLAAPPPIVRVTQLPLLRGSLSFYEATRRWSRGGRNRTGGRLNLLGQRRRRLDSWRERRGLDVVDIARGGGQFVEEAALGAYASNHGW